MEELETRLSLKKPRLWKRREEEGYLVMYRLGSNDEWNPAAFFPSLYQAQEFVRSLDNIPNRREGLSEVKIKSIPTYRRW